MVAILIIVSVIFLIQINVANRCRLLYWNPDGTSSKTAEIRTLAQMYDISVILLGETILRPGLPFRVPNFVVYRRYEVSPQGMAYRGYPMAGSHTKITRIVGGVEAPEGYAPHMAALIWGSPIKSILCGGSIISRRHILTAAHCIDPVVTKGELLPSFHAVVGSNLWNSTDHIVKFSHYKNHPLWDSEQIKNDIGVLFLTDELVFNDRINLVPLGFDWVDGNIPSYVTGWGRLGLRITDNLIIFFPFPDELQLLHLETLPVKRCVKIVEEATSLVESTLSLDPKLEICTLHSVGHGMCYGDSGSPLIEKATGLQIGIASWAFPCARGLPDMFVRISSFWDFLLPYITEF